MSVKRSHLAHEVVGEVCCQHLRHQLLPQLLRIRGHGSHYPGSNTQTVVHRGHGVEQRLLVLLEILVVRAWETLRQTRCGKGYRKESEDDVATSLGRGTSEP